MKLFSLTILILLSFVTSCQTPKDKAINNFESFFTEFKNAYPADKNTDTFKDYSELKEIHEIPEELKLMAEYDTTNFYSVYVYHVSYLRDTLIKISALNIDQRVKDLYSKFKQSIIDGEKKAQYNFKQDKIYADELSLLVKKMTPPKTGYHQTTTVVVKSPDGKTEENKILIKYNNDLELVTFFVLEK